jgi:hypothetical protein
VGFVLVPVPAEHVLDVMRWVLFRADEEDTDPQLRGDTARLMELIARADPTVCALLGRVADATIRKEPLLLRDLADELGRTTGEVTEAIEALNIEALSDERPFVELRKETAIGITGTPARILYVAMRRDLARIARRALREEAP